MLQTTWLNVYTATCSRLLLRDVYQFHCISV